MSWEKRRHWANSSPDQDFAPGFHLFTIISSGIIILGLPLSQLPSIGALIALI